MLHLLLEQQVPITHVIYFENDWDFPQMDAHIKLVEKKTSLKIVRICYYRHFNELLALWGWPKTSGGWCSSKKHRTCMRYIRNVCHGERHEYIGFSADEVNRTYTKWMEQRQWRVSFPLIEAGFSEADSLAYCRSLGYHWDGLYEVFDRVSCFCCPKGGKRKRKLIDQHFRGLAERWKELDVIAAVSGKNKIS